MLIRVCSNILGAGGAGAGAYGASEMAGDSKQDKDLEDEYGESTKEGMAPNGAASKYGDKKYGDRDLDSAQGVSKEKTGLKESALDDIGEQKATDAELEGSEGVKGHPLSPEDLDEAADEQLDEDEKGILKNNNCQIIYKISLRC